MKSSVHHQNASWECYTSLGSLDTSARKTPQTAQTPPGSAALSSPMITDINAGFLLPMPVFLLLLCICYCNAAARKLLKPYFPLPSRSLRNLQAKTRDYFNRWGAKLVHNSSKFIVFPRKLEVHASIWVLRFQIAWFRCHILFLYGKMLVENVELFLDLLRIRAEILRLRLLICTINGYRWTLLASRMLCSDIAVILGL